MKREDQLAVCRTCQHQKFSLNRGVICGISDQVPDFEEKCGLFIEDTDLVNRLNRTGVMSEANIAGAGRRFANHILDLAFVFVFSMIFGFILGIILAIFAPSILTIFESENKILDYAYGFFVFFLYFSTFEAMTGRTPAKFITRTKVINEDGVKPNYSTILLRTLYRLVPFDAFSFLGDNHLGWHDRWSNARVVCAGKK